MSTTADCLTHADFSGFAGLHTAGTIRVSDIWTDRGEQYREKERAREVCNEVMNKNVHKSPIPHYIY